MEPTSIKKFIAEFFGTFCLVIFGCGAAVISGANSTDIPPSGIGLLGISLAFGLSVVVMIYTIGPISGCNINPAISISMFVAGKLSLKDTLGYIIFQCVGAIAASSILYLIASGSPSFHLGEYGLGANGWGKDYLGKYSTLSAFMAEAIFSFIFIVVIFGTTSKRAHASISGIAIGLSLTLIHLFLIPITGTSVNPARSLGPALLDGGMALSQLWLFITAPIIGGVAAAFVWKLIFEEKDLTISP